MPKLTHQTAIVVIPPKDVWEPIQAIRQQHDRKIRRWMPHVTLIYPFLPCERFDDALPAIRSACQSLPPFKITLTDFHSFRHRRDSYTLWLQPEPQEPLVELHAALVASLRDILGPADAGPSRPFRPHLSVGQVRGSHRLHELKRQLQSEWKPVRFPVREVSLIWRNDSPDDVFRVASSVMLGEPPGSP